ncbi:MAG: hypothetical protein AB7G28_09380 [Pirellulales bacterium]
MLNLHRGAASIEFFATLFRHTFTHSPHHPCVRARMARKNQNSVEKRRRDMEKKLRAEDKRKKKLARKQGPVMPEGTK